MSDIARIRESDSPNEFRPAEVVPNTKDQARTVITVHGDRSVTRTALAAAFATAGAAFALTVGHFGLYGLLPAAIVGGVVFVLRARTTLLWPAVLLVFAFIPFTYVSLGQVLDLLSPVVLLALLVVLLRGEATPAWLQAPRNLAWVLIGYLALMGMLQPVLKPASTLVNALGLAITLILVPTRASWPQVLPALARTFGIVAAVLGVWAVVESVTKTSPLAAFYAAAPFPLVQDWDVYRVFTTLGNPLLNSAFFSVVAVMDLAMFVKTAKRSYLVLLGAALVGDVLTFSRTGLIAFAVGCLAVVLLALFRRDQRRAARAWAVVGFVVVVAGALAASGALARYSSGEATSSTQVRTDAYAVIPHILQMTHYLGAGAGSSGQLYAVYGGAAGEFPLENSSLQVLLSFGIPGVLLLLAAYGWLLIRCLKRGALVGPGMLIAYVVAATGFNLFEAYPAALIIPALCLAVTVMEARASELPADAASSVAVSARRPMVGAVR